MLRTRALSTTAARDAVLTGALLVSWLAVWGVLTAAARLCGGDPHATPLDLITPERITEALHAGRAPFPWRLVEAAGTPALPLYWICLTGLAVAAVATGALALRAAMQRGGRSGGGRDRRGLARTTGWAQRRHLRGLHARRGRRAGFRLGRHAGRMLCTEPEASVLVVGPTRSGKTSALLVPNLLAWPGPAVATSTKAELVRLTAGERQARGRVYIYDPTGESTAPGARVTWSPLRGCESLDRAWQIAAWLSGGLQQSGGRSDNDWMHWAESGKLLMAPLLYVAARTGRTLLDVHTWIHGFDLGTPQVLLDELLYGAEHEEALRAAAMLAAIDQRPEKERGTVFSTVMRVFSALNEGAVAESARTSRFDATSFVQETGTLYLCTARLAPERVAGLFIGLLMTVVTAAYDVAERSPDGALPRPLGLFLDELANVVPIEELPSLASQGAGRGVILMSVVQDLSQLRSRYGADRTNSILNNHVCKVVLPGLADPESAEMVSRLAGQRETVEVQTTRSADGRLSRSYTRRAEPLATPDGLRQLSPDHALVVYRGRRPAIVRLCPWYQDRRLRAMARRRHLAGVEHARR